MKGKLLFLLTVIALMATFCLTVNAMSGSGTKSDPYIITTVDDFMAINNDYTAHYRLEADLTLPTSKSAYIMPSDVNTAFSGVFDGNGHSIEVDIQGGTGSSNDTFEALFARVTGQIKNLTVTGSVVGSNKVAGIVGKLYDGGKIDNCVNYASVYGRKNVAGIAGVLFDLNQNTPTDTKITSCANLGQISGHAIKSGVDMGGIVGCVWYTNSNSFCIEGCYNEGTITVPDGLSGENVGGIVGYFYCGTVKNCFNAGSVKASNSSCQGSIFGKTDGGTNTIDGYISLIPDPLVGLAYGKVVTERPFMLESDGVAIYLGQGSGIRGEFHFPKALFDFFASVSTLDLSSLEYGCVVSTKDTITALGGDLLSQEAKDSGKVIFAPAMKNQEVLYSYADALKGSDYHSYRFALTGFPDTKEAYNMEFVILGYVMFTDKEGNQQVHFLNSVKSEGLAESIEGTDYNSVSILRVADVTLSDGDFNGNNDALDTLNHIVSFKDYPNSISIDGIVGYGHTSAAFTSNISSDDTVVFKITNTTFPEFYAYVTELIAGGYELISENAIKNNYYYTFKNGDTLLNVVYWFDVKEATVSLETVTTLPQVTQPSYTKTNEPSITQIKLEASIPEGMSYVIHLSDGSFFIIDGGWSDENENEADKLYNTLVSLAGEGNDIVIAGWIFTHCHGDHIGTFNLFAEKYHDSVTIKQLLYNFPSDTDISNSASSYMLNDTKQRYINFRYVISTYLPNTEIVKLHSGYKLYYADAEVEILQTLEDLYPKTVANYDFNSSSTIFTVTIGKERMIFLGDVSDAGASRLTSLYSDSLKSDFMQVAHHGLNNNSTMKALYQKIDAEYILYPAPISWYESNINATANKYLSSDSTTVKQIFVSGAQTVTIYLPYDGKLYNGEKAPGTTVTPPPPAIDDLDEVERPSGEVTVPNPYFDLDLSDGTAKDACDNAEVTVKGGAIEETTVTHNGEEKTVTAFTGGGSDIYYMTVDFNNINSDEDWGKFVMNSSTFEVFIKFDTLSNQTVGIFTSCNSGGVTIYLRRSGQQINFQIGSTSPNGNTDSGRNYSAAVNMNNDGPIPEAEELLHIVGSYNKDTNKMKLYINGKLVGEADYGTGSFKGGSNTDHILGLGYNPQYNSNNAEAISKYADYELYEARIYDKALTDEQVAQQYWNCIDNLFKAEAEND